MLQTRMTLYHGQITREPGENTVLALIGWTTVHFVRLSMNLTKYFATPLETTPIGPQTSL